MLPTMMLVPIIFFLALVHDGLATMSSSEPEPGAGSCSCPDGTTAVLTGNPSRRLMEEPSDESEDVEDSFAEANVSILPDISILMYETASTEQFTGAVGRGLQCACIADSTTTTTRPPGDCSPPTMLIDGSNISLCAEGLGMIPEFDKCTLQCPAGYAIAFASSNTNFAGRPQCIDTSFDVTFSCRPNCLEGEIDVLESGTDVFLKKQTCPETSHGETCDAECPNGYKDVEHAPCSQGSFGNSLCAEMPCNTAPARLDNTLPSWLPERCAGMPSGGKCTITCDVGFRGVSNGQWADDPAFVCDKGTFTNPQAYSCMPYQGDEILPVQSAQIVSATFAGTFTKIEVLFSAPIRLCPALGSIVTTDGSCVQNGISESCDGLCSRNAEGLPCFDVLDPVFNADLLGHNPTCSLSADRVTFIIALGDAPAIEIGNTIVFKGETVFNGVVGPDENLIAHHNNVIDGVQVPEGGGAHYKYFALFGDHLRTNVMTEPDATQTLGVSLAGPSDARECGSLKFFATSSQGAEGRPLVYKWAVGPATSTVLRYSLYQRLLQESGPSVTILADEWYTILNAARTNGVLTGPDLTIEVYVNIKNWRGVADEASKLVPVLTQAVPKPTLSYASPPHIDINRLEDATFQVKTAGILRSACGNTANATATPWQIYVNWQVQSSAALANIPNMALNVLVSHLGESFNVADTSKDQNILTVPALEGDNLRYRGMSSNGLSTITYIAQAYYGHDGSALEGSLVSLPFTMSVSGVPNATVVLSGPAQVRQGCPYSFVADVNTLNLYDTTDDVPEIYWNVDFNGNNVYLGAASNIDRLSSGVYQTVFSSVDFGTGQSVGNYVFTVQGQRQANTLSGWTLSPFGTALEVEVTQTAIPPPITVVSSWAEADRLTVQKPQGFKVAGNQPQGVCTYDPTGWSYYWVILQEDTFQSIVGTYPANIESTSTSIEYWTTEFPGDQLVAGSRYRYVLVYSSDANAEYKVFHHSDLPSLQSDSFFSVPSVYFIPDSVPSSGELLVSPIYGYAITGKFSLSAVNWIDDTPNSVLEYDLFQFPLPETHPLYASMQCVEGDAACVTSLDWQGDGDAAAFPIEWDNNQDPNYWIDIGGQMLRTWASDHVFDDVRFSPGKYILAVRVKDKAGGIGGTKVLGCTVVPKPQLSTTDVVNYFEEAKMTANPDVQLNAILAVTSSMASRYHSDEIVMKSIAALDSTSDNYVPDQKVLAKVGKAVESVAQQDLSVEQVTAVTNSLESSLQEPPPEGLTAESTKQLVPALTALHLKMKSKTAAVAAASNGTNSSNSNASAQTTASAAAHSDRMVAMAVTIGKHLNDNVDIGSVTSIITSINGSAGVNIHAGRETAETMSSNVSGDCFKNLTGVRVTNCADTYHKSITDASRRLQALDNTRRLTGAGGRRLNSCDGSAGLHQSVWVASNPHEVEDSVDLFVPVDASVRNVQIIACDLTVDIEISYPLQIDLKVPFGQKERIACVRYVRGEWITDGLRLREPYTINAGDDVVCEVFKLSGAVTYGIAFANHGESAANVANATNATNFSNVTWTVVPVNYSAPVNYSVPVNNYTGVFRLCPSVYLPQFHNISWKCAPENSTIRTAYVTPGRYISKGSTCIPLCSDGLVTNPMTALANCLHKGWKMHEVSDMYCSGWWEDDEESAHARDLRLPTSILMVLLSYVALTP